MKKKITRIWGIGLALVLAASMLLSVAPVSAGTLSWGAEDLPDKFVTYDGQDITDISVSGDGSVIYASTNGTSTIYRSTNAGQSWSSITVVKSSITIIAKYLAVTPDDANYIAVASDNGTVYISKDAGANWSNLGQCGTVPYDLAISAEKGGNHTVALAGDNGTGPQVWYYEIGAVGASWQDAHGDGGFATGDDYARAVAFSPNFSSDQVMVAVTFDDSAEEINYQVYSFNTNVWNSGAFSDFPVNLRQDSETFATIESASIALAPDYLGSDDSMRIAFVGLAVETGTDMNSEGIFRLDNDDVEVLKDEKAIYSVAYDGSLLVAGRYDANGVYRCTDPLGDSPSVSGSTSTKNPGGVDKVVVGIAADKVVAGTSGDNSAFAYSTDSGKCFNDLSLIDTFLSVLSDVATSPDGSKVYLVTGDNDTTPDLSVWCYEDRWERIYTELAADDDYIIRMAPDDPNIIYLADAGLTTIYFSSGGGVDKWQTRVYKETTGVVDMAVETDGDTVYVMTTLGYVSKSTNRGFTWASKVSSKLSGGSSMLKSLGEDKLIAGSSDGYVAYSTDGNTSWTKLDDDLGDAVQVTAAGLADGDFVFAASNALTSPIYHWQLGTDDEWDDIVTVSTNYTVQGLVLEQGVLYAVADNSTDSYLYRSLNPTSDEASFNAITSAGETFDLIPSALKVSRSGDVTKLWAIDSYSTDELFSYKDTLATVKPTLAGPADGYVLKVNPISGHAHDMTFTWNEPSDKVTSYDIVIALDSGFNEKAMDMAVSSDASVVGLVVGPTGSSKTEGGTVFSYVLEFMPDTTYYWKVRVDANTMGTSSLGPVRGQWSEARTFTVEAAEVMPPVIIQQAPAPIISVPPAPAITLQPPEIVLPAPPPAPPDIIIPAAPAPTPPVPTWAIYAIIIIGAVLVLALIILIMRTRRPV